MAISLDADALDRRDRLVEAGAYPSRSRAIEAAVREKLERPGRNRLAGEAAQARSSFEQARAEEGMSAEIASWRRSSHDRDAVERTKLGEILIA